MKISNIIQTLILCIGAPIPFCWWICISIPTALIRGIRFQRKELILAYKHYFGE